MIEAREQWLIDAQAVRKLREEARAALESGEIAGIAAGMIQKHILERLNLWDRDGEKFEGGMRQVEIIDELIRVSELYSRMDDRYLRGIAAGVNIALEALLKQENAPQPTKAMRDIKNSTRPL